MVQHDISRVGEESYRLSQYQHRIKTEDTVAHDDGTAHKADDPESHGQYRLLAPVAILPLIDKPQREDDLSC